MLEREQTGELQSLKTSFIKKKKKKVELFPLQLSGPDPSYTLYDYTTQALAVDIWYRSYPYSIRQSNVPIATLLFAMQWQWTTYSNTQSFCFVPLENKGYNSMYKFEVRIS